MADKDAIYAGTSILAAPASYTSEMKPDYRPKCYEYDSSQNPFLTLLTGAAAMGSSAPLSSSPVHTEGEFGWFEKSDVARYSTLTAEASAATTSLTIASSTPYSYGDVVMVDSNTAGNAGEIMWVSANPSTATAITVRRAQGGTTAVIIGNGSRIKRIGSNMPDHDILRKGAIMGGRTLLTGYVQWHWRELEYSDRMLCQMSYYDDTEWGIDTREALRQVKRDLEDSLWFNGPATKVASSSTPSSYQTYRGSQTPYQYYTAGVRGKIVTNTFDGGNNLQYLDFCAMVGAVAQQNNGCLDKLRLVAFCGNPVLGQIAEWGLDALRETPGAWKTWGLSTRSVIVPRLPSQETLTFVYTPTFDGGMWENAIILLNFGGDDGGDLQYRYLEDTVRGRKYDLRASDKEGEDISPLGGTQTVAKWQGTGGLECRHERRGAIVLNACNRSW